MCANRKNQVSQSEGIYVFISREIRNIFQEVFKLPLQVLVILPITAILKSGRVRCGIAS